MKVRMTVRAIGTQSAMRTIWLVSRLKLLTKVRTEVRSKSSQSEARTDYVTQSDCSEMLRCDQKRNEDNRAS